MVRTVPDDGAERDLYVQRRRPDAPGLAREVNDGLREHLTRAAVRTEAFVTVVVRESRLGRQARECGGGLEGRARVLHSVMGEVEAQLRGGLGMTSVTWLTSPSWPWRAGPGSRRGTGPSSWRPWPPAPVIPR